MQDAFGRSRSPFVATALLLIPFQASTLAAQSERARVTVVFRYDDYSARSPFEFEKRLFDILAERNIPTSVAVIPKVASRDWNDDSEQPLLELTAEKAAYLREAVADGRIDATLHGLSHQRLKAAGTRSTEFQGVDPEEQCRRIAEGKALLDEVTGTSAITFIPPFNRYDRNTLACVESAGMRAISADLGSPVDASSRLAFIPYIAEHPHILEAVRIAAGRVEENPVVVWMLHPQDFREGGENKQQISLPEFAAMVDQITGDPLVEVSTLSHLAVSRTDLSAVRYAKLNALQRRGAYPVLPGFLKRTILTPRYYPSEREIDAQPWRSLLALCSFIAAVVLMSFLIARSYVTLTNSGPLSPRGRRWIGAAGIFLVMALMPLWRWHFDPWTGGVYVSALIAGGLLASGLKFRQGSGETPDHSRGREPTARQET